MSGVSSSRLSVLMNFTNIRGMLLRLCRVISEAFYSFKSNSKTRVSSDRNGQGDEGIHGIIHGPGQCKSVPLIQAHVLNRPC
jgi:hypothetical protein